MELTVLDNGQGCEPIHEQSSVWLRPAGHARARRAAGWDAAGWPPTRARLARRRGAPAQPSGTSGGQRHVRTRNQGEGLAMAERLRVLIVDDQRLLCEGFRKLIELEPDLEVVGMAGDGEEALAMVERLSATRTAPDVVLMDVRMPRLDGIAATRAFSERWPEIRVVILTTFDERELIQAGLQAGAHGYLLKDITAEQLATTIRVVAQGQVLLHPDVAHKVLASFSSAPIEPAMIAPATPAFVGVSDVAQLTEREREILALLARGASNREISETLFIAGGTVKNHLSNILGKLGVRDRTQAALKARELGLL